MAIDRRVKYTKMVLRESLIKLLKQKPISRITIKEICADADINRATYYAHYSDQFDQLKQIEFEIASDITSYLDNSGECKSYTNTILMTEKIFEYLSENSELCRVLLGKNGDMDFEANIMKIISGRIIPEWKKNSNIDQATSEYIYTFVVTGCIGVIKKWLLEDSNRSHSEMAKLIYTLANNRMHSLPE